MKEYLFTFLLSILLTLQGYTQIGGVINTYQPVTDIVCNSVTVPDASGFLPGDMVLLIQMKGALVYVGNSSDFGRVVDYSDCGNFELQTISSITKNTIFFKYTILKNYSVNHDVQLVRVPQYSNVSVTSTLTCKPWNGSTGGIVAMMVSDNLTLSSDIDVTAKGFRGGSQCSNPDGNCGSGYTEYYYPLSSGYGAERGEGISRPLSAYLQAGRGAVANGGGGGNKHNSGGGGGGNYSAGGQGGSQASVCAPAVVGGLGGHGLDYNRSKIFLGGGGGAPDHNDGVGTPGANGGGIIIIMAKTVTGNGHSFIANGGDVPTIANGIGDGAGGGGGGGTILLDVKNYNGSLNIFANGGNGGDQNTSAAACFAPGGGGGCGVIEFATGTMPANVIAATIEGKAGTDINPASQCYQGTFGATAGKPGQGFKFNLPVPRSTTPVSTHVDLGSDSLLCGQPLILNAFNTGASYLWSTNETTPTITVTTAGTYWVSVSFPNCPVPIIDTVKISTSTLNVSVSQTDVTCKGKCDGTATITVNSGNPPFVYSWNSPTVQTTAKATDLCAGIFTCTVTESKGCKKTVNSTITEPSGLQIKLTTTDEKCTEKGSASAIVSGGTAPYSYHWEPGSSQTNVIHDLKSGKYTFSVSDKNGCSSNQSFDIQKVNAGVTADFKASPDVTDALHPEIQFTNLSVPVVNYLWDFGDGKQDSVNPYPVHLYADTGNYRVCLHIVNTEKCTSEKCETIMITPVYSVYIPNAFSPDGDNLNETFGASGSGIMEYELLVFDRWGRVVFKSSDIRERWDGSVHNNGSQEKQDAYVYVCTVTDPLKREHRYTGTVMLIR